MNIAKHRVKYCIYILMLQVVFLNYSTLCMEYLNYLLKKYKIYIKNNLTFGVIIDILKKEYKLLGLLLGSRQDQIL